MTAYMPAIAPDTNAGPRGNWRCAERSPHGHRCRYRAFHSGPCRAFGVGFYGHVKAARRKAARSRKVVES